LEKYAEEVKNAVSEIKGVEFKGSLSPWIKKYNLTFFFESKNLPD